MLELEKTLHSSNPMSMQCQQTPQNRTCSPEVWGMPPSHCLLSAVAVFVLLPTDFAGPHGCYNVVIV